MIYQAKFAEEARTMCRLGATDEELAEHFEVRVRTIYRWRNTHEEFAEAVVAGKEFADARVERALYSRAVGCSVQRTKVFRTAADPDPVYATYVDHLPPDTQAALQWLRVREPKKWAVRRDRDDIDDDDMDEAAWEDAFQHRLDRAARRNEEIERAGQQSPEPPPAPPPAPPPPPPAPPSPPQPPRPTAAPQPTPPRPARDPASAPPRVETTPASREAPASNARAIADKAPASPPKAATPHPREQFYAERARAREEDVPWDPSWGDAPRRSGAAPPPHASPAPPPPPPARPPTPPAPPAPVPAPAPAPRPLFERFPRPGGGYGQPPPPADG